MDLPTIGIQTIKDCKKYGLNLKNYINSFKFFNSELSIPIYYDLKNREIKKIFKVCKKLLKIEIMKK